MTIRSTPTARRLRRHFHFIVIVPLLIIVSTWPIATNIFDHDIFWLPSQDQDVFMKMWDAWYGQSLLRGQVDFYFTELLFHPVGLSLEFHNFSLPHMAVFGGLQLLMSADDAYSLTHLLIILANTLSGYVVLLAWFRNRWVALAGAVAFGMHPYIIGHSQHPEVTFVACIPLALYALHRGINQRRTVWLLISGFLIGFTALIGMYMFVCLLATCLFFAIFLASRNWRNVRYWRYLALVFALAAAVSSIRIYPMLANQQALDEALDKGRAEQRSGDVLEYVANLRHPHMGPVFSSFLGGLALHKHSGHSYLGLVFFAVVAYALLARHRRRQLYPWLAAVLFFSIMRLGAVLEINGQAYKEILLPEYYLTSWFPWLFRGFWDVEHYLIGILFPSAVLFAHGLEQISARVSARWRPFALLAILLLLSYERTIAPLQGLTIPAERTDFIDWLANEPNQVDIHVINLPMGRIFSKEYGFFQTLGGYPRAEGRAARTPSAAYEYIESNELLESWRHERVVHCMPGTADAFQQPLQQMQSDGFTHLILHHRFDDFKSLERAFTLVPAAYSDRTVSVYRLEDLHQSCDSTALLNLSPPHDLADIFDSSIAVPDQSVAVLSIHSFDSAGDELLDYYVVLDPDTDIVFPLRSDYLPEPGTSQTDAHTFDPTVALAANQMVIVAYDPRHAAPSVIADYKPWVAREFKSCGRLVTGSELEMELFLVTEFPCELVMHDEFDDVHYDNRSQLGNLILQQDEKALDVLFKWNRLAWDKHSVSIQFFNSDDAKVFNQDFVVSRRSLGRYRVDMTGLAPGDYDVRLVLYNFETLASVRGKVVSADTGFERELVLTSLTLE